MLFLHSFGRPALAGHPKALDEEQEIIHIAELR